MWAKWWSTGFPCPTEAAQLHTCEEDSNSCTAAVERGILNEVQHAEVWKYSQEFTLGRLETVGSKVTVLLVQVPLSYWTSFTNKVRGRNY